MKNMIEKFNYNAPVTLTFTFLALGVQLLNSLIRDQAVINWFALRPYFSSGTFFRSITYVFTHGDFNHFFANFSIILLIGPMIEEKYGSKRLLLMGIITALFTATLHILFFNSGLIGASGIVFMLILLTPFTNMKTGKIPMTLLLVACFYIGREVFLAITVDDNVSRFAHIFGGFVGGAIGYFLHSFKR